MVSRRTPSPARVFIDASVLFAAALSAHGYARDLPLAGMNGLIVLCCSPFALDETERNITAKAPAALPAFRLFRDVFGAQLVVPTRRQVLRAARVVDLKDAPIVAGAVRTGARFLATYDRRHLLAQAPAIHAAFGVRTATPDEILSALGLRQPPAQPE